MSERQSKSTQDRHERILNEIVKNPGNENCADCGSKNPRWASYSLGVFLCIRCAGIHRKMGTHISKVKSITMDQWNTDQIEMMRKSGGNIAVNSRINPNPGNNPLPLASDDDHVMERYIRAKWEKRSFMADNRIATPPKNPITRLQVLPKRSSSVPTITQDPLVAGLNKLRDLGYKDEVKNKQVLIQTQGNLDAAIEILTRNASTPQPATMTAPMFLTDEQKIEQLMRLGFTDRNNNLDALRRSGGNLDIAITILNDTKSILQQQQQQQNGLAGQIVQPTQQQQQQLAFRSNSVPVTSANNNNFLIDVDNTSTTMNSNTNNVFSNPFGLNTQLQQQQQQMQQQLFQQQQQQQMLQHQQMLQQQQQFMLQQQQQNNMFSNPFGLTTPSAVTATVFNNTPQTVTTPSSNPFSQMTASPYNTTTNNNNSYFQPTSLQQQTPQQQTYQTNPWSNNTLF